MIELGSSDAAVIMGCSPYKTPWKLAAELSGLLPEDDYESEVMAWGTILQDSVLREFALRERFVIEKDQPSYHHRSKPYLRATPDGLCLRYERGNDRAIMALVEVKAFVSHAPDVPRVDHLVQVLHQRLVAETVETIDEQYLVYFGGLRMVWFEVPRHQGAIDRILREEEKFLAMLERGELPPVSARDASALNRAWPWVEPRAVELPGLLLECDHVIEQAEQHMERLKGLRDDAEAQIKAYLGDATTGTFSDGTKYDWKGYTRKGYTVKEARIRRFTRHGRKETGDGL